MKKTEDISIFKNQFNLFQLFFKKKCRARVRLFIVQLKLAQLSKSINVIETKKVKEDLFC